ncbi:MAG: hypothetical protein OEV89_06190 [Desulfobulbaceae bacterium]|nr:hypothetical protein [Desulfobulbaceae bacterium]HIJ90341.1 hypothetical protein [Deltaproteobacteria bacterium]
MTPNKKEGLVTWDSSALETKARAEKAIPGASVADNGAIKKMYRTEEELQP